MNLCPEYKGCKVNYAITGTWSEKAAKEAEKYCHVCRVTPKLDKFTSIPDVDTWKVFYYIFICLEIFFLLSNVIDYFFSFISFIFFFSCTVFLNIGIFSFHDKNGNNDECITVFYLDSASNTYIYVNNVDRS